MKNLRVFVTGATGFIGEMLIEKLLLENNKVTVLVRQKTPFIIKHQEKLHIVYGDLSSIEVIEKATQQVDVIFHLAGFAQIWAKKPDFYFKINVDGTENILKAARINKIKKVVVTSSAGAFGPQNNQQLITENHQADQKPFTHYEQSKLEMNNLVKQYAKNGLPVCMVSPTRVFGLSTLSKSNTVSHMIYKYTKGKWRVIPGNGKSIGNYAFIDDVVNGYFLAAQHGVAGENYILGGENLSFNQFFNTISEVSGKKFVLLNIPIGLMLLFGYLNEVFTKLTGKKPVITRPWILKYLHNWATNITKAQTHLGYKVTPFKTAVKITLNRFEDLN